MKQKINIRLWLIALIAIISTTIGITFVYYNLFQNQVMDDLKENAKLLVEAEVFQNAYTSNAGNESGLTYFKSGKIRITWIDSNGEVLFDNDTGTMELSNHIDRPEIQEAIKYGEGSSKRHSDTLDMDTFYYAIMLDNGTILRVSTQARNITSVFLTAMPVILSISVWVLLACMLLGHFLTVQLMKPIEKMAENLEDVDIAAYKELEPFAEKIRSQHENILAAAKMRQDFTANVTHELKTPITAISGYAEIIENHLFDKDEEVHIAQEIRHNADRLQTLISDIIKLSELDHSELSGHFETTDIYEIAIECVNDLESFALKKSVTLECEGTSVFVNADKSLIHEMIDNLVQNSIRYNKEGGKVWVSVSEVDGHGLISVKDNGIGIPADQLDRIFERFYRVDKSRSRETGGTGLGLAIVKHIVELHSARIFIESELNKGTEIRISF